MSCLWLKKQNSMKLSVKAGENTSTIILENGLALPREVEQTALWLCTFTAQEAGHVCTTSLYTNVHSNMLCNKHAWNHAQTSINGRRDKLGCTYITWYYTAMKINELKLHTEQHKWIFKKKKISLRERNQTQNHLLLCDSIYMSFKSSKKPSVLFKHANRW